MAENIFSKKFRQVALDIEKNVFLRRQKTECFLSSVG